MTMSVFLSVNGQEVSVARAIRHALLDPRAGALVASLVEQELLRQHARSIGVTVSDGELQEAANEMRHARGLRERDRTVEWLRAHQQTLESVQEEIELFLLRQKVMRAIPEAAVEDYYREHRDALEYVVLFCIRAASEREAAAQRARLDAGEPFPVVASDASRDASARRTGGFVGSLRRAEMSDDIAQAVFAADVGRPFGPIPTEKGYGIFLVAARQVPALVDAAADIRALLFDTLMARLRADAVVRFPPIEDTSSAGAW
jgi:parvulin-like peptidyl-prolyl isomerase